MTETPLSCYEHYGSWVVSVWKFEKSEELFPSRKHRNVSMIVMSMDISPPMSFVRKYAKHISCAMFEAAIWSARDFMIDWPSRGVTSLFFFSSGWKLGFFERSFLKIELHLDLLLKDRESYTSLQLFSKIRAQSRTGNKPNIFDTFFDWWKPKITIDLTLLWLINEVDFYFFSSVGLL